MTLERWPETICQECSNWKERAMKTNWPYYGHAADVFGMFTMPIVMN